MYAIIETGGKQLKVEAGDTIFVEKLDVEAGEKVVFDKVLAVGDKTMKLGAPYVKGATVEATVEKQGKEKKVVIYKYNAKKHYHKKQGHRQPYTKLVINTINKTDSGEYGKDLVCAGVSTVGIGAMNMLAKKGFLAKGLGTIEINEGYINVVVNHTDEVCQVVLETLVVTLETMVESYGRFIKISKVEV